MRTGRVALATALAATAACSSTSPLSLDAVRACGAQAVRAPHLIGTYGSFDPAVSGGCVVFDSNDATDTAEYLVVAQSLGGTPGASAGFGLAAATPGALATPPAAAAPPRGSVALQFDGFLRRLAASLPPTGAGSRRATRLLSGPPTTFAAPPAVGDLRSFKVCGDVNCGGLETVTARVRAVGQHVAIYVDTAAPAPGLGAADVDSLLTELDQRLYPLDVRTFGTPSDIDGNGVVIALVTGAVNALVPRAQCTSSNYVVGFFFPPDINPNTARSHNDAEIMYLLAPDPAGTLSCPHSVAEVLALVGGTFVHELQHMINYNQHVLVRGGPPEDAWLDEALSRMAEELAGRSYLPGDTSAFSSYVLDDLYNAEQYFFDPGGHALITTTDQDLGDVGAGWLYLRYLTDQFGTGVLARLTQTSDAGTVNVASATGRPFAETAAAWALANWYSDLPDGVRQPELHYTSWSFREAYGSLHGTDPTNFPQAFPLTPQVVTSDTLSANGTLHAGSGSYFRFLRPPGAEALTVRFSAGESAIVPRLTVLRIR